MLIKALKPFNDGWAQKYRKEGDVFEATEDAVKYWRSLGLIEESGESDESGVVNFDRMNKAQLIEYAKTNGVEVDETMTKKELIEVLTLSEG